MSEDFGESSDVDVMVTFEPNSTPGLQFVEMKGELEKLFGRPFDVVTRKAIESHNPYRRESTLSTARVIYEKEAA